MRHHHRFSDEDLTRLAAVVLDPLPAEAIPQARRTAAELRAMADAQQRRSDLRRRWVGTLSVAAVTMLVFLGAAVAFQRQAHPAPPSNGPHRSATATPAPLPLSGPGDPARETLKALAATASHRTDPPATGRYTYVHTQSWSADTTTPAAAPATRDEQLWWAPDHTGQALVTTLHGLPTGVAPASLAGTTQRSSYDRDHRLDVVVEQPSDDPALLAAQLNDHEPFSNGPQAALRAVVSLYRYHDLNPAQAAAALIVLANTDGLLSRGLVTDRLGRPATAITIDTDTAGTATRPERDVLLLNPADGAVLGYERLTLNPTPAVTDYVLFLANTRTDKLTAG